VPFTTVLDRPTPAKAEIVEVTAVAGLTWTITRGVDGTTAQAHTAGAPVTHDTSARDFAQTVSNQGGDTITVSAAAVKGLVVKGAASQSASLQEWQDSAGGQLAKIQFNGSWVVGAGNAIGTVTVVNPVSQIGLVVRGAASQGFDLQEWQNSSGTILARVEASGQLTSLQQSASNYGIAVIPQSANTATPLHVRNGASSGANLTEWANSSGTVLATVQASGNITSVAGIGIGDQSPGMPNTYGMITSVYTSASCLKLRGAVSQTANLQEWQNSSGVLVAGIGNDGRIKQQSGMVINSARTAGAGAAIPGNPATWLLIDVGGSNYYIPLWT
jgi:hypothetical protein